MREVEAEIVRGHIRAFLLHVAAQYFSECLMQKVRAAVVVGYVLPPLCIHRQLERAGAVRRQFLCDVDGEVVFLHGVQNPDSLAVLGLNPA